MSIRLSNQLQNYVITTPPGGTLSYVPWISPITIERTLLVTFTDETELNNYFSTGGRIQLSFSHGLGTLADNTLSTMFADIGLIIVYGQGTFQTGGNAGSLLGPTIGGLNATETYQTLYTINDGTPFYSASNFKIEMRRPFTITSPYLEFLMTLDIVTAGTIPDTYIGTLTSNIQQRNLTGVTVPTFGGYFLPTPEYNARWFNPPTQNITPPTLPDPTSVDVGFP